MGIRDSIIAGKAVCFGEALKPEFKEYQKKIVENAAHLAHCLTQEGFDLVGGGTDNHLLLLDLRSMNITGKEPVSYTHLLLSSRGESFIISGWQKKASVQNKNML